MNVSTITPEQAWQMTLDQLRLEMPKADFDTWVSSAHFVAFGDGVITVGIPNAYGRDWLASRLTGTVNRLLTGILDEPVEVQFTVMEEMSERRGEASLLYVEAPVPEQQPKVMSLQAEYQSVYDEIVHPDQVIVVPGYFLRYLPLLGPELAWLYVGFRQAAYEAGVSRRPEKKFNAPSKKVARYAGMSLRAFWRWVARPDTWNRLRGLVTQVDSPVQWSRGKDGRPHQSARTYRVAMTLPLTPYDERSLRAWLYQQFAQGKTPLAVLEKALETSPDELIPWPEKVQLEKITDEPHSVQEVITSVCGSVPESQSAKFQDLAEQLAQHLMPPKDLVILTHYFVTHWLPRLGPGAGWLVTLLRDRGYINPRTGEIRDEVILPDGYAEAANRLGTKRVKTIWEWLKSSAVANFVQEIGRETGSWEDAPRRFKVCPGEPLTEADQKRASQVLGMQFIGANGTHSEAGEVNSVGASGTHNGGNGTHRPGANGIHSGASGTHSEKSVGASGIHNGGNGTHSEAGEVIHIGARGIHSGGNGTHRLGADGTPVGGSGTPVGADDIHRHGASGTLPWREWHSLNSLTPGFKHPENTSTTSSGSTSFDAEESNGLINKKVVAGDWNLSDLLSLNRISLKNQELLLDKGVTVQSFISWLLYAASQGGSGIRDPIGHAVSRLIQDPSRGAGGVYERLAVLPAGELIDMLTREMSGASPWNTDWSTAMADAPRTRLRALADQLGVPVPKVNDW